MLAGCLHAEGEESSSDEAQEEGGKGKQLQKGGKHKAAKGGDGSGGRHAAGGVEWAYAAFSRGPDCCVTEAIVV